MDVDKLRAAIAIDREAGLYPVCVAANAGTTNTGAIDKARRRDRRPLPGRRPLVPHRRRLWRFGIMSEQAGHMYSGMERADSIAVDPAQVALYPPSNAAASSSATARPCATPSALSRPTCRKTAPNRGSANTASSRPAASAPSKFG
ncbi:MAG: hypothetical protein IPK52_26245 [Chloroflexi bacterium]|nr:hypothetical protein [Chloroflexota bacterium]